MRHLPFAVALLLGTAVASARAADNAITPVPASAVQLSDGFWKPRLDALRTVTLPGMLERLESSGKMSNFTRAAAALGGEQAADGRGPVNAFDDAEVYRVIEAAAFMLAATPDLKIDGQLDPLIAKIAAAQEKDGYLYTARTMNPAQPPAYAGAERWALEKMDSYELYDLGCLFNAAAAHTRATGKKSLLAVAVKAADLLDATFGPDKKSIWPGHEGVELGLINLYRVTGEARYWKLAQFMIEQRGPDAGAATAAAGGTGRGRGARGGPARGPGSAYSQAQGKFVDATQAVGYAPGAMNLYAAAAELVPLADNPAYGAALGKVYDNLAGTKMYVTGGIGAGNDGTLPRNYLLNSVNAYSSTDAAATFVLLNERLFQLHADAQYVDALERALYNALLVGMSADGKTFFDTSPLEFAPIGGGRGNLRAQRRDTFNTAYSPTSAVRTVAEVPGLLYAQSADAVYVNLYAQNTATIKMQNGRTIKIEEQCNYPWDGNIKLTVTPDQAAQFALNVRTPGWAIGSPSNGELYAPAGAAVTEMARPLTLKLNGQEVAAAPSNNGQPALSSGKGFASINRQWSAGDTIEISFDMRPRKIQANAQVADARNRLALQRGPIIYCAEGVDNANNKVRNIVLPAEAALAAEFKTGTLGGVEVLTGKAFALMVDEEDKPARVEQAFIAAPYFAWANRGVGEMTTWVAGADSAAVATSKPTLIAAARLTASPHPPTAAAPNGPPTNAEACRDGIEPRSSGDNSPLSHFDWWPATNGAAEWVQAEWPEAITITSTSVYWWDDTGVGECRPPTMWKALYKDGETWKPVETEDKFGLEKDKYNRVTFKPVKTTALRLEMVMPNSPQGQQLSVGIQEWKIR